MINILTERVFDFMRNNLNKTLESPRTLVFKKGRQPQTFKIVEFDDAKQRIKIEFQESGTKLPLEFWRFELAIEFLFERGEFVRIGASLDAQDKSSLEWVLQKHEKEFYGRRAGTKTAPHVGDILVLAGVAEYGKIRNPKTRRMTQAIRLKTEQP